MLLRLLNFWLYPIFGMFFAASAVGDVGAIGGGDAGGGDAGGGEGSGDVGDGGDPGDPDVSGADGEVADGADAQGNADDQANADPDKKVDLGDGRQVPGKWKKAFELAKQAGVEKEVKQLYFAQQRLTKAIPGGVNGAIELAKAVEEFGGVEGVQQLQSDIEAYKSDGDLFERADPRWVESGFQENPESALKLFSHSLDYVGEHHPEQYDHLMAKVIVNDLDQGLPVRDLHSFLANLKDKDGNAIPQAAQLAKKLADYYNSRFETSRKVPEKKVDAQQKALTDRETKLEKKEMDLRFSEVNREVFPQMKTDVTKTLQAEAKLAGIDLNKLATEYPGEWRSMLNDIHGKIMSAAGKDQRFIDKYYALVKKGDLKRATAAVNAKHAAIIPDIARAVMQSYGVFKGKKAAAGNKGGVGDKGNAGAGAATQGWTRVSARPQNSTIDWSKTTSAMQLDGKYILNDGKKVVVNY